MKRTVWFDARNLKNPKDILPLIFNLRYEHIVIKKDMAGKLKPPRKMHIIIDIDQEEKIDDLPKNATLLSTNPEALEKARSMGYKIAYFQRVDSRETMENAWQMGCKADYLVAEIASDTNIPLELLIARLQGKGTNLLKVVRTLQEAEIAYGVMEVGSEGVVLVSEVIEEIVGLNHFMEKSMRGKLDLVKGVVTEIEHIGMGSRSCIDTTTILEKNEGMLIGSTSQGGILVSSENHFLPYMELRPFRVNAGAVHSYVWTPEGKTGYLTELKAGSKVLSIDTEGNTREISVGRVKTEVRPLLKIEVEAKGVKVNVIVQDDWHIRIFGGNGEVRNASEIRVGDELLTYICEGGRHVGIKIDETISEK